MHNNIIKHDLSIPYETLNEIYLVEHLRDKINKQKEIYPLTALLLSNILQANKHLNLLEDWLIIMPYLLMWIDNKSDKDKERIQWFENLFNKIVEIDPTSWEGWLKEIVQKCNSTNDLYNRFYDYLAHLYAAIVLHKEGFDRIVFPSQGSGVDIEAFYQGAPCAIECKFIKTSKKLESFCQRWWPVRTAFSKVVPLTISLFEFPSSNSITCLKSYDTDAIKSFTEEVCKNPEVSHSGSYKRADKKIEFRYFSSLPLALVPICYQSKFTDDLAVNFLEKSLKSTITKAIKQLNHAKYSSYKKYVFLAIQWDPEYGIDWTWTSIEKIKEQCKQEYAKDGIRIMFSEDYSFPVDGWL